MSRAARLTQADVTRFVRGVLQAAKKEEKSVAAVDIRADGSARVFFGEPAHAPDLTSEGPDEWDRLIASA
jgi:hypothetical protein